LSKWAGDGASGYNTGVYCQGNYKNREIIEWLIIFQFGTAMYGGGRGRTLSLFLFCLVRRFGSRAPPSGSGRSVVVTDRRMVAGWVGLVGLGIGRP
jgi:hypothetical protein